MRTASVSLILLVLPIGVGAHADTAVTRDGIVLTGEMALAKDKPASETQSLN